MASFLRKTMRYLGLVDDEYDDEAYDEPARPDPGGAGRSMAEGGDGVYQTGSVRTIPRDAGDDNDPGAVAMTPRPSVVRTAPSPPPPPVKVHVVEPAGFADAQEIGDRLRATQPVIVTLQGLDADLSRRLIDFCSGAAYVLGGTMERVADRVFLLTPSNVEVPAEERRRLQERGLYRS